MQPQLGIRKRVPSTELGTKLWIIIETEFFVFIFRLWVTHTLYDALDSRNKGYFCARLHFILCMLCMLLVLTTSASIHFYLSSSWTVLLSPLILQFLYVVTTGCTHHDIINWILQTRLIDLISRRVSKPPPKWSHLLPEFSLYSLQFNMKSIRHDTAFLGSK